jgi:hypothetical protein
MAERNKVQFLIEIDETGQPVVKNLDKDFKHLDKTAEKTGKTFGGVKSAWLMMTGAMAAFGVARMAREFLDLANAASDMSETLSKSTIIYGEQEAAIEAWASTSAEAMGLSTQAALEHTATLGNMFNQLGAGVDVSAKVSMGMVQLSADIASLHNVTGGASEVLLGMQSAFRGEYDALQRYIPTINAAAVQQTALSMTGKKAAKELTNIEKAMAAVEVITKGAGVAVGDYGRTAAGAANQQRTLEANIADLRTEIGKELLPILGETVTEINKFIDGLTKEDIRFVAESIKILADSFVGLGKAIVSVPGIIIKIAGAMETEVTVVNEDTTAWLRNTEARRRAAEVHEAWRLAQHRAAPAAPDPPGGGPGGGGGGGKGPGGIGVFDMGFDFELMKTELTEYQALMKEVAKAEQEFNDAKIVSSGTDAIMEEQLRRGIGDHIELADQKQTAWAAEQEAMTALAESHDMVRDSLSSLMSADQAYIALRGAVKNAIVSSILGYESMGAAFKKAIAQELATISSQAAIWTILETGMGFASLARYDFAAAGNHFTAAAILAGVAAASGVAASALASSAGGVSSGESTGYQESRGGAVESLGREADQRRDYAQKMEVHFHNMVGTREFVTDMMLPELKKVAKRDTEITVTFD